MTEANKQPEKKKRWDARTRKRLIFYVIMLTIPVLQNLVFYVGVNLNSILKAFQKYDVGANGYEVSFAGFQNFNAAWTYLKDAEYMIKNSLILYVVQTTVGLTLALVFSYYIYKKCFLSGTFKLLLFMPQIVSGLVFCLLFKYFAGATYVSLIEKLTGKKVLGLLADPDTRFTTVMIYHVFVGFGVKILMFSGAMSGIDESVVEAAELDGISFWGEFVHISVPLIYPTLVSFIVIGIAGATMDQMSLFSMFGGGARDIATLGYYLYSSTTGAQLIEQNSLPSYGTLSAVGLIITIVVVPIVMICKKLLNHFGPSEE